VKNKFHRKILYAGLRVLIAVARVVPRRALLRCASAAGSGVFRLLRKEREKTLRNLRSVFAAEKTEQDIVRIGCAVFVNLAKNLAEWILLDRMTEGELGRLVEIRGREHIEGVLARGKGVLVLTAHIGNWEFLAAYVALFIRHGGVIGRKVYVEAYDRLLVEMRRKKRVETFYSTDSPKRILQMLKANCVIGVLPDQDVGYLNGVFVDFMGRPAYTPTGPVALALASGADIVPAFLIRQPDDRYVIHVEPPVGIAASGDKKSDLLEYTARWSGVCEKYIRAYPEQWVWMHNRWKTKQPAVAARTGAGR